MSDILDDYLDHLYEGSIKKKVATASVATALAALGATYHAYKKVMDGMEKACKNTPDKDVCMAAFRRKAYKARVSSLTKRMKDCTKTNNPGKCRKYIRKTITALKKRIR